MSKAITLKINNKTITTEENHTKRLLDFLREDMDITGPKEGCGEGECGACAVIIDKELVNSCLVTIGSVQGKEITNSGRTKGNKAI